MKSILLFLAAFIITSVIKPAEAAAGTEGPNWAAIRIPFEIKDGAG